MDVGGSGGSRLIARLERDLVDTGGVVVVVDLDVVAVVVVVVVVG